MNILKKNKTYFVIIFLALLLGAFLISAQGRELEIQYPELGGIQPKTTSISPQEYVKYIFNFALWIIGITAFGSLILGGVRFLTSVGSPSKRTDAKNQITVAVLGVAILLGSYFILYSINPQLTILESKEIEKVEITPPDPFELPEVTTSINVELPIETMLKESTYGLFGIGRITRIKNIAGETTETAHNVKHWSDKLKETSEDCTCLSPCGTGCLTPVCEGKCEMKEGECKQSCAPLYCTSDPCCKVREKLTEIKLKNITSINELQEQNKKTEEEILSIETMTEKIQKTLKIMKNDCPLSGIMSRDQFISLKDYYIKQGWKLKKIQYWDEFETLIPSSQADFYCPVGGNQSSYIPESELTEEDIEEYNEIFLDWLREGGEFETIIDCPQPIPFGEVIDKGLEIVSGLIEKMKELAELQNEMIGAIDTLHKAVSECTSKNCKPVCGCTCCGQECGCKGCNCVGTPCPIISVKEIAGIDENISKKQKEIEKIINKDIPNFLNGSFEEMAEKIHFCIADPSEIESGWILLNCERAIGAIGPEGKIFEKKNECKISGNCSILENCYEYNFFCCRTKD